MTREHGSIDPLDQNFSVESWPFYWIARVNNRYTHDMEKALRPFGLYMTYWRVLMILHQYPRSSISELAAKAIVGLSTMTKIIQRLERTALVATKHRVGDARTTEVTITASGEEYLSKAREVASALLHKYFRNISKSERAKLLTILRKLFDNSTGI
jgi:DNA-binding MarR family transcriptional regulator